MMKTCTIVFSQNLVIESIGRIAKYIKECEKAILLTTHQLFDYEIEIISNILRMRVENKAFVDFLTFEEMKYCDEEAYELEKDSLVKYDEKIKEIKNQIVLRNFEKTFKTDIKLILCDDLGIDIKVWQKKDYKFVTCRYYNNTEVSCLTRIKEILRDLPIIKSYLVKRNEKSTSLDEEVYIGSWKDKKYIFIGKMNRVGYRVDILFEKSVEEAKRLYDGLYWDKDKCTYLTSLHESYRVKVPDDDRYEVFQIQDGYLPPFYSCLYKFKPNNHKYYAWDSIGELVFRYLDLPVSIMPFRKKIYLPVPIFPKKIKTVLIVASGAGDWTAMKNRSDEDRMVSAFVDVAKANPCISFVYRCHPVWVHPNHNGVNSINRVVEYFSRLNLDNLKISTSIPKVNMNNFTATYPRQSLEEDLKTADIVFGDHSVSMIDAAINGTIFSSVNVTGRQNLFKSITDLGFPHCESVGDINKLLTEVYSDSFQKEYLKSIERYNMMTDMEEQI